jgi:hypothetical protein
MLLNQVEIQEPIQNLFPKRIYTKIRSQTFHFTPSINECNSTINHPIIVIKTQFMINDGACSSINAEHLRLLDVLMWNSTVGRGVATNGP